MFKDSVDFKNIEFLEKVEKFLKMCMKSFVIKVFGLEYYIKVFKEIVYLCYFIYFLNYNLCGIFWLICLLVLDFILVLIIIF